MSDFFENVIDFVVEFLGWIFGIFIAVLVVGIIVAWIWTTSAWVNTKETLNNCHVNSKESVTKNGSNSYRVYTDNCGVLSVSDEAWLGIWNSGDTYNKIQPNKDYTFDTVGFRNGFMSWFPNIVKVDTK